MPIDPAVRDHKAWLGYLQPDGLVVSASALVDAQAILDRNTLPLQQRFLPFVSESEDEHGEAVAVVKDVPIFLQEFLEWPDESLYGLDVDRPIPEALQVPLRELGTTLSPTIAFADPRAAEGETRWLLLVKILPTGTNLDQRDLSQKVQWSASEYQRFERLLRETGVPIGLLANGICFRLVYAPHGENSGSVTFPVRPMTEVAGRPILAAFDLLLNSYRLLAAPDEARLPALLRKSREYQSSVSTMLAQQVLDALYELLRGFQSADGRVHGELLKGPLAEQPDQVYAALLTVLLRLVFLLYAEDRGLMPSSELYIQNYSVHRLFEKLRADNEQYPDTMDHRFGAWAQLAALCRAVFDGCKNPQLLVPARSGHLFDPDRYPFLEGRTTQSQSLPLVADGTVFRVLEKLLILDGERLSYRTLDVEDIGSVYQTIMGFRLELAAGPSIALTGKRKHKGEVPAPSVVSLEELLAVKPADRSRWVKDQANHELPPAADESLRAAKTIDDMLAALDRRIARDATPSVVPKGSMVLQPTDERRRSGSHYTPRSLTEPIVRKTLEPILKRLGDRPTPEQILALKICDLAMGSAAFLVETCRQLAEVLVKAWHNHAQVPAIPPDEDETLLARRMVAQRCLYGVDRNPMAVDLAKLSLWLVTLAKDHPFTFLDHALRCGDSLVGLTREQILAFHWDPSKAIERYFGQEELERIVDKATAARAEILNMPADSVAAVLLKREKLNAADQALAAVRQNADIAIAAFFAGTKDKERLCLRDEYMAKLIELRKDFTKITWLLETLKELHGEPHPVLPFHWEVEFPEVFLRDNPGFDAIVGNPPFAGKNTLLAANGPGYLDWLITLHAESHGNADLVAHFFRRAYLLLRKDGCFGLVATNTIGQGDTRHTGLRWICTNGGTIYAARKRLKWPGQAAVIVSVVNVVKGGHSGPCELDGRTVPKVTAYLFHAGGSDDPAGLAANSDSSFIGSYLLGMGFTFDDTGVSGDANSLADMRELIRNCPRNAERIFPFIGGEEICDSPTHAFHRYAINFYDMPLRRVRTGRSWDSLADDERRRCLTRGEVSADYPDPVAEDWPELIGIVREKVKPVRDRQKRDALRTRWWQYAEKRPGLVAAAARLQHVLVCSQTSKYLGFARLSPRLIFSHKVVVVTMPLYSDLAVLQSRIHEYWARFFGSTLEDRPVYTPSDCFEPFPFPGGWQEHTALEHTGRVYYEFRADLMVKNNEGLTQTYNRFHDPGEISPDIVRLREMHDAMDQAVLDSYGWSDIRPRCEFLLEYEEEDEEGGQVGRRKKPWRYRWPDELRDEVLARLLALNAQRAEEERLTIAAHDAPGSTRKRGRRKKLDDGGAQNVLDI